MKLPSVWTSETKMAGFMTCLPFALALFACVLVSAPRAFGQGATAQINGSIRDASGAVIPGASVTVTNADTKTQRAAESQFGTGYIGLLPRTGHRGNPTRRLS